VPQQPQLIHPSSQLGRISNRRDSAPGWWAERCIPYRGTDPGDDVVDVLLPCPDRSGEVIAGELGKIVHAETPSQLDQERQRVERANACLDLLEPVTTAPNEAGQDRPGQPS
jgi:hypothetical protein